MQGIVCDTDKRVIDEAPAAYKDLTQARCQGPMSQLHESLQKCF